MCPMHSRVKILSSSTASPGRSSYRRPATYSARTRVLPIFSASMMGAAMKVPSRRRLRRVVHCNEDAPATLARPDPGVYVDFWCHTARIPVVEDGRILRVTGNVLHLELAHVLVQAHRWVVRVGTNTCHHQFAQQFHVRPALAVVADDDP